MIDGSADVKKKRVAFEAAQQARLVFLGSWCLAWSCSFFQCTILNYFYVDSNSEALSSLSLNKYDTIGNNVEYERKDYFLSSMKYDIQYTMRKRKIK